MWNSRAIFAGFLFTSIVNLTQYAKRHSYLFAVADLGRGRPPTAPNFLNFMQFFAKFGKIICWRPPWRVGAPSYVESWIRPCFVCVKFRVAMIQKKLVAIFTSPRKRSYWKVMFSWVSVHGGVHGWGSGGGMHGRECAWLGGMCDWSVWFGGHAWLEPHMPPPPVQLASGRHASYWTGARENQMW